METVACNLCGSTQTRLVYKMPDALFFKDEWFDVVECRCCGLGFVNPRPPVDEIFRYYPASHYEGFSRDYEDHQRRYAIEGALVEKFSGKSSGTLLDVGCANGDFPRYMKTRGWQVEGVEASPNSKRIADFTVYEQVFTDIPVHEPRYDVVTAWAVLKHVHDPKAYFQKAAQVLKPGGVFVFLVTNFQSLSSRCLFHEDIPRHLYFFNEKTVRRYLKECGMELRDADYSNRIYEMRAANWLYYYLHRLVTGRRLGWKHLPQGRLDYLRARPERKPRFAPALRRDASASDAGSDFGSHLRKVPNARQKLRHRDLRRHEISVGTSAKQRADGTRTRIG